eukprot:GFKZ01005243.1.p1 GENE.GFKZ01005243.1~~GFKZ01005243.1.p1  ORF type:complete len:183 (-),score=15.93 GFKZ01005243.1:435-983(-)
MTSQRTSFQTTQSPSSPRPSSAIHYDHPYLPQRQKTVPKRELGLFDLMLMKVFRCFVVEDELPPPDPTATVYQADRSGSTMMSLNTLTNSSAREEERESPLIKLPKYNQPPPEQRPVRRVQSVGAAGTWRERESTSAWKERRLGASASHGATPGALDAEGSAPQVEVQRFGKVSSLSAMFEN